MDENAGEEVEERRPVPPWLAAVVGGTSLVLLIAVGTFFVSARGKELKEAHRWVVVAGTLLFSLLSLAGIGIAAVELGKWISWRGKKA